MGCAVPWISGRARNARPTRRTGAGHRTFLRGSAFALALLALLTTWPVTVSAAQRFPQPQFEVTYQMPRATEPSARPELMENIDVAVLLVTLSLAAYLALQYRRRLPLFLLMIFSLGYFGFYRKGCICSIGAIQNVALAMADSTYAIPATAVAFFMLPLVFALLFGRVFCAAVCPLGAVQDIVILKPLRLPRWLSHSLGLLPYVYLGLAVLLAVTGAGFMICRYDPFVGFFRLGAPLPMLATGAGLLLLGIFIARPYCRFLCPYGALLNAVSRFSRWHLSISPDECIQCRLCDPSCPFDAIRSPDDNPPRVRGPAARFRVATILAATPVLMLLGAWLVAGISPLISRMHPTVQLAEQVREMETGLVDEPGETVIAFRSQGISPTELYKQAAAIQGRFAPAGRVLGAFLGLVFALKLIGLSIRRTRTGWEPDRATCLSCARCLAYSPLEQQRRQGAQPTLKAPTP